MSCRLKPGVGDGALVSRSRRVDSLAARAYSGPSAAAAIVTAATARRVSADPRRHHRPRAVNSEPRPR